MEIQRNINTLLLGGGFPNKGVNGSGGGAAEPGSTYGTTKDVLFSVEEPAAPAKADASEFINNNMQAVLDKFGCKTVAELKAKIASGEVSATKVQDAIFTWIKDNYKYKTDSSGNDWASFEEMAAALLNGSGGGDGDCEDIASFMMDLMNSLGMNASLAIKPEKDGVPGHVVTIVENPDGTYNVFDATTGTSQKNISAAELAKQGYTIRMTSEGAEYDMVTGKPTNAAVGNTEGVATPTSAQYNSTAAGVDIATIWTTVATDNSALVGATAKAVTITMSDGTTVQGYYVTDKSGKNYLLVDSSGNGKFEASECVSTSITPSAASVNGTNGTSSTVDVQAIFDNEMKKNAFTPRAGNDLATVAYNIGQKLDQIYKSMMGLTASTELFGGGSSMSPGTTMMLSMLMENCKSGIAALSAAGKACNDVGVKGMSSFADALR